MASENEKNSDIEFAESTPDTTGKLAPEKCWKTKTFKMFLTRLFFRLFTIALIFIIGYIFKPSRVVKAYMSWIESYPLIYSLSLFVALGSLYAALAPGFVVLLLRDFFFFNNIHCRFICSYGIGWCNLWCLVGLVFRLLAC